MSIKNNFIFYCKLMIIPVIILIIFLLKKSKERYIKKIEDNNYDIEIIDNFLTDEECDYIIEISREKLKRSSVVGNEKNEISKVRTSTNTFINQKYDPKLKNIAKKVSKFNGFPIKNQESIQVLNYKIGQKYDKHYDACYQDTPNCKKDRKRGGFRHNTILVYLSNVEEGGETTFPKINKSVKPVKGRAVFFKNLTSDNKSHHIKSLHQAKPVISGEKWAMNIWTRLETFV